MKKITFIVASLALASLTIFLGCKKKPTVVEFDIPYTVDFTIPSSSVSVNVQKDYPVPDINTNISKWFSDNNTTVERVGEMTCTKFMLSVVSPTNQSINFIKELNFLINANTQEEQQQAFKWITVAQSNTLTALDMTKDYTGSSAGANAKGVNDINAKNYCTQPSFNLKARLTPSTTISSNVTLRINCTYHAKGITAN